MCLHISDWLITNASRLAACCSGNTLVLINQVALHRGRPVTTWMGECLETDKPSHVGQLSLPSLHIGKLSTGLSGWVKTGCVHLCRVAGNTV